jgi:MinD-like ATPase involved in chromosome partitioning or flagellar assembly
VSGGLPVDPTTRADVGVAVASGGASWEPPLLPLIEAHRSGLRLVRRCVDLAELLAVCRAGLASVAIVAASLPRIERDDLVGLERLGVTVVMMAEDPASAAGLAGPAARVLPAGSDPDEVIAALRASQRGRPQRTPEESPAAPIVSPARGAGRVIAVCSPPGAPGRTTVTVGLAATLAARGSEVMAIDADTRGGAVGTVLGLVDDTPGLPAACRSASRGRMDAAVLAAHAVRLDDGLRVLTAPPRPDRWREMRPSALADVLHTARRLADVVLVDCAGGLPQASADGFEIATTEPGAATASVLDAADLTLLVGSADPVGLVRLAYALEAAAETSPDFAPMLVVNRVRTSAAGRRPDRHVLHTLARIAPSRPVQLLPDDPDSVDRAVLRGQALPLVAPSSPLSVALAQLADRFGSASQTAGSRSTRRVRPRVRSIV